MKKRQNISLWGLLTSVMVAMAVMWSCSDSDDISETTSASAKGNAFIQLTINTSGSSSTRADMSTDEGSSTEREITSLKAVLTDGSVIKDIVTFTLKDAGDDSSLRVTEPASVDAGIYYIYVLANYDECDLTSLSVGDSFTDEQVISVSKYTGSSCPLAESNKFLMTNADEVGQTTIYEGSSKYEAYLKTEVSNDGSTEETDGEEYVNVISVDVERAVAKITPSVTYVADNFTITDAYGNSQVIAPINKVALATMNSTEYLFKQQLEYDDNSVTDLAYDNLYYAEDPNFGSDYFTDDVLTSLEDNAEWESPFYGYLKDDVSDNLTTVGSTFYCLENTMDADYQRKGIATCLIFQAQITDPVFTRLYTSDATNYPLNSYESAYATIFSQVVEACSDGSVTNTLFEPESSDQKTFYLYNNLLFASAEAARMYKVIATNGSDTSAEDLLTTYQEDETEIDCYEDGYMYYTYYIKHNTASTVDNEWGKYGVVRNHHYQITVTGVTSGDGDDGDFGDPDPEPYTPGDNDDDPDDGDGDDPIDSSNSTKLQVVLTINKWNVISDSSVILTND